MEVQKSADIHSLRGKGTINHTDKAGRDLARLGCESSMPPDPMGLVQMWCFEWIQKSPILEVPTRSR
jgi:hypothetical protein